MRTHFSFVCIALFALLAFSNCRKAEEEPTLATSAQEAIERGGESGFCDEVPPQTNFISLLMRDKDGNAAPMMCLTEQQITQVLRTSGKYSEEMGESISRLFYKAEKATPARAFQFGQFMADHYGYAKESFNIDVMGRADYPAPATTRTSKSAPAPGFIDFYTIRQSRTVPGQTLILPGGFSGLRFQNKCTGQMVTFSFPATLDGFKATFLNAGFSQKETDLVVESITNGTYSIRQLWDLFQTALAPRLPITQTLLAKPDANCWRLRQVGINLSNLESTKASFYYAQGDGALK